MSTSAEPSPQAAKVTTDANSPSCSDFKATACYDTPTRSVSGPGSRSCHCSHSRSEPGLDRLVVARPDRSVAGRAVRQEVEVSARLAQRYMASE